MKRVFPLRSNTLALALALSFAIGTPGYNQADAKSPWNPMSWLSTGNGSEKAAAEASKQAEAAEQAANRAMLEAQKAMEKASEAKRKAEALQAGTAPATAEKPVVVAPTSASNQGQSEATSTPEQNAGRMELSPNPQKVYQEASSQTAPSTENSKPEPWNPLTWFKKQEVAPATDQAVTTTQTQATLQVAPEKAPEKNMDTTAAEKQPEPTNEHKGGNWNPMKWFAPPASQAASADSAKEPEATPKAQATEVAEKNQAAVIETEKGNIAIELYPDQAPQTVANFTKLVNQGFYNRFNMKFHRVVPGFVIQTGDPTGTGAGGSKETIPLEAKNKLSHNAKGVVAMARGQDPNSATSQFYITLAPQTSLDGKYAVFGKVISGYEVLDKIEKDDMMYGIKIVDINSIVREPSPDKKNFFSSLVPH